VFKVTSKRQVIKEDHRNPAIFRNAIQTRIRMGSILIPVPPTT